MRIAPVGSVPHPQPVPVAPDQPLTSTCAWGDGLEMRGVGELPGRVEATATSAASACATLPVCALGFPPASKASNTLSTAPADQAASVDTARDALLMDRAAASPTSTLPVAATAAMGGPPPRPTTPLEGSTSTSTSTSTSLPAGEYFLDRPLTADGTMRDSAVSPSETATPSYGQHGQPTNASRRGRRASVPTVSTAVSTSGTSNALPATRGPARAGRRKSADAGVLGVDERAAEALALGLARGRCETSPPSADVLDAAFVFPVRLGESTTAPRKS